MERAGAEAGAGATGGAGVETAAPPADSASNSLYSAPPRFVSWELFLLRGGPKPSERAEAGAGKGAGAGAGAASSSSTAVYSAGGVTGSWSGRSLLIALLRVCICASRPKSLRDAMRDATQPSAFPPLQATSGLGFRAPTLQPCSKCRGGPCICKRVGTCICKRRVEQCTHQNLCARIFRFEVLRKPI